MDATQILDRLDSIRKRLDALAEAQAVGPPRYLSIDGAADYVSLSADSVRRLIAAGRLSPYRPVRGKILVDRLELEAVIRSSTGRVRNSRGAAAGAAARRRNGR